MFVLMAEQRVEFHSNRGPLRKRGYFPVKLIEVFEVGRRILARAELRSTLHPCDFRVVTFGTHDELAPRGIQLLQLHEGGGGGGGGREGRGAECEELKMKGRKEGRKEGARLCIQS